MTTVVETPRPPDTGSDGSQTSPGSDFSLIESQPLTSHLARTIAGLAESNNRAFGGAITSALVAGATSHMARELAQAQTELACLRKKNEALTDTLSEFKSKNAVLIERIDSYRTNRHLKNLGIFAGTSILGIGIKLVIGKQNGYGLPLMVVGTLLLVLSWLSAPKGGDK